MFESDCGATGFGGDAEAAIDAALGSIERGITSLNGVELWRLRDGALRETAVRARRLLAALDDAGLRVLAAVQERPDSVPGAPPDRAAATLLRSVTQAAPGAAHADAAAAVLLHASDGSDVSGSEGPGLPLMREALAEGAITRGHVDVVCSAVRRLPRRLLDVVDPEGVSGWAKVDRVMCALSRLAPPRSVQVAARHLLEVLAPDRADRFDPDADRRRELTFRHDDTGMLIGRFALDAASGLAFSTAVQAFAAADASASGTCAREAEGGAKGGAKGGAEGGAERGGAVDGEPEALRVPDLR